MAFGHTERATGRLTFDVLEHLDRASENDKPGYVKLYYSEKAEGTLLGEGEEKTDERPEISTLAARPD